MNQPLAALSPDEPGMLRAALTHVAMGLLVVDEDLTVVLWNLWMADTSGVPAEQAIGRTLAEIFPDTRLRRLRRKVRQVVLLGNQAFFDARVHGAVLPLRRATPLHSDEGWIQQSCTLSPVDVGGRRLVCVTIADETAAVIAERKLKEAHRALAASARRDALTGLLNRAAIRKQLCEELARSMRYDAPLSVVLFDIDHFKAVNDTYGHLGGDAALRHVGAVARSCARETDFVGRYGGEEFLMVLPHTAPEGALRAAERLRSALRSALVAYGDHDIRVTASFGVATTHGPERLEDLVLRADLALYSAKNGGRDRVVEAPPPVPDSAL